MRGHFKAVAEDISGDRIICYVPESVRSHWDEEQCQPSVTRQQGQLASVIVHKGKIVQSRFDIMDILDSALLTENSNG